jgi:acyl-CoA thioester hydrolase
MSEVFTQSVTVRYFEVDQQGVVFNMWYLAWFDDAMTGFLAHRGLDYDTLLASGCDVMLVHTEIDWRGGARWGERLDVAVSPARIGRTSFTLDFQVRRDGEAIADGRTVYVVVAPDGSGKRQIDGALRAALGEERPLRSE